MTINKKTKTVKKTRKKTGKDIRLENLEKTKFKKGESGNPNGRPKGRKNFKTLFLESIDKLSKDANIDPDSIEVGIVLKGISEARKGNFAFYKDILDRLYGKAPQTLDLNTKIKQELSDEQKEILKKLLKDD